MRLTNALIAAGSVILGGFLSEGINTTVWISAGAVLLITGAGNLINDFFDRRTDEINRPERLIPSGKFTEKQVLAISIVLFIAGNVILLFQGLHLFLLGAGATFLLVLYTPILKPHPLTGNITVSLLLSLTIILGEISSSFRIHHTIFPAFLIFFINLPREILKDGEDIEGDRKFNIRTFPVVFGKNAAVSLVRILLYILMGLIIAGFFIYGKVFTLISIFGLIIPLSIIIYRASPTQSWFANSQRVIKITMISGIIALIGSNLP